MQARMRFVGVDPGLSPAVAVIEGMTCRVERVASSGRWLDERAVARVFRELRDAVVAVERCGPVAQQGIGSTGRFLAAYGAILGVLAGLGMRYEVVSPVVWKRVVLGQACIGAGKVVQKQAACRRAVEYFPNLRLIRPRCRVPDHNLADAVCLALYAQETWGHEQAA